jgi:PAS domain S-box-containing protein
MKLYEVMDRNELLRELRTLQSQREAADFDAAGLSPEGSRTDQRLLQSEERYRRLVEYSPDAILVHSEGRYVYANNAALALFGVDEVGRLVGREVLSTVHPEYRDIVAVRMKQMSNGEILAPLREIRMLRADGSCVDVEAMGAGIIYQGKPAIQSVMRDITARKQVEESLHKAHTELEKRVAERTLTLTHTVNVLQEEIVRREQVEAALRGSEEKYRSLFEESKDVICIVGAAGGLLEINRAGSELFGYTKEELLHPDLSRELYCDPLELERFLQMLSTKGYVRNFDLRMKGKGGAILHVLKTASIIRTDRGEFAGYRGIIHDITARRLLEQQLLQAQKMESIGLLAGGVAHDFNNLLTAISGYSQIIRDHFAARDETLGTCIDQVLSATARAVELTRNLLAFSRKQIINPQPVQVNDIVFNLSKLLTRIIGEDIEFTTRLVSRDMAVMADSSQIDQVLINLATNARDAMPRGGRIEIRTDHVDLDLETALRCDLDKEGAYALIALSDNGHGMDRETQEKIFEPFYTTKEKGKGTGLGLSIIYGIVKQHNGGITVNSRPGKGTTFTIYLPLVEVIAVPEQKEERPLPARGTETVLLAEDEEAVRSYLEKLLEMAGYTVIVARDGVEAIERYGESRETIALVMCDVVMPKKNGREVQKAVRRMNPLAKFLFISGYNDEIIHSKGVLQKNIDFLQKPVDGNVLLSKVREIIEA